MFLFKNPFLRRKNDEKVQSLFVPSSAFAVEGYSWQYQP
jgi:hypothetical protein